MADHSGQPGFGRLQQRSQVGIRSASSYRYLPGSRANITGNDRYGRERPLTRPRPGPDRKTSDDGQDSDHSSSPSTRIHEEREPEQHLRRYRPKVTVDWRAEILRLLGIAHNVSDDELFEFMNEASEKLQEVDRLRDLANIQQIPPRVQVIHSVYCHTSRRTDQYPDQPWVVANGMHIHIQAGQRIENFELFLERNKEIAFVVYKQYECCDRSNPLPRRDYEEINLDIDASALFKGEHIDLLAHESKAALASVFDTALKEIPHPDLNDRQGEAEFGEKHISYPYLWYFHGRKEIDQAINDLPLAERRYVDPFRSYVEERMSAAWKTADSLLDAGMISAKYIDYLFVPGRVLISHQNGDGLSQVEGFLIREWLEQRRYQNTLTLFVDVESWKFDGQFVKTDYTLHIDGLPSFEDDFSVTDLPVYPMAFASQEVIDTLRSRGRMFWKCRTRKYVSYEHPGAADGAQDLSHPRYMIDMATYEQMHSDPDAKESPSRQGADKVRELELRHMSQDNPDLGDDFFMCLPATIRGFDMQKKAWDNLYVHFVKDVVWNTEAFKFLVINDETKKLIRAVVTNHIRGREHSDLISGKGNGLFILLHGGPGTGKTLTAESVAEIASRPLYRVTCGDIGTKAEAVEKYLEFVLFLGKTWDCVVLLDEADVFLEQRSLVTLERNALVSVFLRVLEYYDGILILTSNRVGTFDEAFKSRIQLNLSYKKLDKDQRLQIWKNFLGRLETSEKQRLGYDAQSSGIDMEQINTEVEALAEVELNGRQIRNAISTARKLASFDNECLGASHIKAVMREMVNFDKYLLELNDNFTPEQIQRDSKVRLDI